MLPGPSLGYMSPPNPHKRLKSKKIILSSSSETVVLAYNHSIGETKKGRKIKKFKPGRARILLKSSQEPAMLEQPLISARGRQRQPDL